MDIKIEQAIKDAAPGMKVAAIEADVENSATPDELWDSLTRLATDLQGVMQLPDVNKRPGIAATRKVYKALGKDPNRYRPSAEALCRRAVKGMDLYRIDTLVDLINLLSMMTGYSIGGFDLNKIQGTKLSLGVGQEGEPFEAIGRGQLNIAGLPVYRDEVGGIGTPTSDNERTKLDINTTRLLMCINIYGEEVPVDETIALTQQLLTKYAKAQNINVKIVMP